MPYDANGNATITRQRAVTGQTVEADQVNVPFDDAQAMLSQVVLRSGVAPMMGALNMNGFRILNIAEASNDGDPVTLAQVREMVSDPWAMQPVGAFVAYDAGEALTPPPKNKTYRYVQLTAGLTGAGAYNEGILTSETTTGTAPNIVSTAVVSLTGSPMNGKTIRLINTEGRFIRPSVTGGAMQDSQNLSHGHTINDPGHFHNSDPAFKAQGVVADGSGIGWLFPGNADPFKTNTKTTGITINQSGGDEARPRNIGVVYFRRIK